MTDFRAEVAAKEAVSIPRYIIFFIGALVAIGPLSLDAYLPAMPAMAESFGVGIVRINNTISLYLVGYGLGQFFGGALSDQIGRKRVGLMGLGVFTLASISIAFAQSVEQVQWLRFVQAIGGGFSTVICMAIVRDVYPVEQLGKRMAMVTMIMLASPVVAPSIGAFLLRFGWPAIFVFKACYSTLLGLTYLIAVPETRPGRWRDISLLSTLRQCAAVVRRKVDGARLPLRYAFTMACVASVFMTFLTNSSFAYIEYFGVSETVFPLYFGVSILGLMASNLFSIRKLTRANAPRFFQIGVRTQGAAVAALLIVVLTGPAHILLVVAPVAVMVATFGISGIFFDGSLRPMVFTMMAASLSANFLAATMPRRKPPRQI
jgi:DHA1 family bicyclomycin/chloramphenicol resistance-like MFS transporter